MTGNTLMIRTRFAPSPTGYLHIGGARTAIFNWLFARANGGDFVLRIEDTDRERSTDASIEQIEAALQWLGIDYDEGPYRQTERGALYRGYIDKLLQTGHAYRCTCPKEELDRKREAMMKAGAKPMYDGTCRDKNITADCKKPFVVRFATPQEGKTVIHDLLRGDVVFQNSELDDIIIARSDGSPTYNFVVVVDDTEMKISHVIRGDDHLSNTPRQAVIYKALGFDLPTFAHVSMILGKDGKRLSKRHGALSVLEYRDKGILPEAFICYMTRLGWSHGDQEVFSIAELQKLFSFDSVSKSAARFDEEKMEWVNAAFLKVADENRLAPLMKEALQHEGIEAGEEKLRAILPMLKTRARNLIDLAASCRYFFTDEIDYQPKARKKFLTAEIAERLEELATNLESVDFDSGEALENAISALLDKHQLKLKALAQPIRVCLTGGTVSPGLYELMRHLGRESTISRIRKGVEVARQPVADGA